MVNSNDINLMFTTIALGFEQIARVNPVAIAPTMGGRRGIGQPILTHQTGFPGILDRPDFRNQGFQVRLQRAEQQSTTFFWVRSLTVPPDLLKLSRRDVESHNMMGIAYNL